MPRKKSRKELLREELREQLWPGMEAEVWSGAGEKGYFPAPRVLPLLLRLMGEPKLVGNLDCSKVYVELIARDFGQGIVEIGHEEDHGYFSGYSLSRARRSWKERISMLEKLGFIMIKPKGHRRIGYVFIRHYGLAVQELRDKGKIDDAWWDMYLLRLREVGASVPSRPRKAFRVVEGGGGA